MKTQQESPSLVLRLLALCFTAGLALPSCGGGGGGGGGQPGQNVEQEPPVEEPIDDEPIKEEEEEEEDEPAPSPAPETVDESLEAFGIDIRQDPREEVDGSGLELPADYAPLGTTFSVNPLSELFLARATNGNDARLFEDLTQNPPRNDGNVVRDQLAVKELGSLPTIDPATPKVFNAYTHGDVDGNGQDEVIGVSHRGGERLFLWMMGDKEARYRVTEIFFKAPRFSLDSVAIVAGDFDADGIDEVAIAWADNRNRNVFLNFIGDANEGFAFDFDQRIELEHGSFADSDIVIRLAAGNLDFDPGLELAAVVNTFNTLRENAQLTLIDDQASGHQVMRTLRPSPENEAICDVTMGDVDGDTIEEVVIGGSLIESRNNRRDFMVILDDSIRGLQEMHRETFSAAQSPNGWVEVNTLNIDSDPQREIQVGNKLFDDLASRGPVLLQTMSADFIETDTPFNWNTSSVATGDFDGDKIDDILVYYDGNRSQGSSYVAVYGFLDRQFQRLGKLDVRGDEQDRSQGSPVMLMPDTDGDSAVVRSATDYKLVFTEPVVLAVLAAAPYTNNITQNVGSCSTVLGSSQSSGFDVDNSLSVSASVSVGVSIEDRLFTQSAFELEATLTSTLTVLTAESYEITQSVSFENGPDDDAVIFYSIPYDQYSYTIVSMPDDPETLDVDESELAGQEVVFSLPRQPVLLKVERTFFNQNLVDGSLRIDESVFTHTVGDHRSYMTESQALQDFGGDLGLFSQSQDVGQGSGANGVSIDVAEAHGVGGSLAVGFEVSAKVTFGGVSIGGSIGVEGESGIVINSGSSTTYAGTVGDIQDPDFFGQNLYEWGLFTYLQTDPRSGQQFEVINYWVNPRD